jgi:hypothetical protein
MRKLMRYVLQLTVSIMFGILILGIQFYVSSSKERFIGNLHEVDSFAIVDTHISETWHHQLLRTLNTSNKTVAFFLYTNHGGATFKFFDLANSLIFEVSEVESIDDYHLITLDTEHLNVIRMEVEIEDSLVDTVTFVYFNLYRDAQLLDVHQHPVEQLLLHDTVVEHMTLFQFIEQELILLGIIIIGFTVFFNVIHILWKKLKPIHLIFSEHYLNVLERIKAIISKMVWVFKQLFYNIFGGLFLFVITSFMLVILFEEESSESQESLHQALYFNQVHDGFDISVSIGVSDSTWNDSDYGPHYIYYKIVFNQKPSGYYVASIWTESGYQGSALSDQGLILTGYEDDDYSTIDIYFESDFGSSDSFKLVIRDAHTGLIVFESDEYRLYQTYDDVRLDFGIIIDPDPWRFSLYIFLFHVMVTTSLIRYLYFKGTDKRLARQAKRKALQDSQAYWDQK